MRDKVEELHESDKDFILVSPSLFKRLHKSEYLYTIPDTKARKNGSVAKLNGSDIYTSTILKKGYEAFNYTERLPPHMIREWFEKAFEEEAEIEDVNSEERRYKVSGYVEVPLAGEVLLDKGISVDKNADQISEIDIVNEAKTHLKNELKRDLEEVYYNDK